MSKEYEEDIGFEPQSPTESMNIMIKDYYRLYAKNVNGTINPYERVRFNNLKNTLKINKV